jgi:hypothetical protein
MTNAAAQSHVDDESASYAGDGKASGAPNSLSGCYGLTSIQSHLRATRGGVIGTDNFMDVATASNPRSAA